MSIFSLNHKVIVLTGGYGILGACMARHLAKEGARVVVLGRNAEKGESLAAELRRAGGESLFLRADVLDSDALARAREEILRAYGAIDVLVNLAGGNRPGATVPPDRTVFDLEPEAFRAVVDLNLTGTLLPTLAFARPMAERGRGSVINISSEASLRPLTRVAGYGCAKAAVNNLTRYLAVELARKYGEGLRVNAIAPGFFLTDQNRALMTNPDGSPSDRCRTVIAHTPFGRLGKPEELLGTLQWLASDASAFVTGVVVPVDGGFDAFSI